MTYDATILADSPTAFWTLKDTVGATTAADATGNGHDGTPVGSGITFGATSLLSADSETAATFPGNNSGPGRIVIPFSSAFATTTKVTVEAWIKLNTVPTATARIFNAGIGGSNGYAVGFDSTGRPKVTAYAVADITATGASALSSGTTYFLAYVIDQTAGHVLFYVDGSLVDTQTLSNLVAVTSNIAIGNAASGSEDGIDGVIQKVAVYTGVALTGTQIAAHHSAGIASGGSVTGAATLSGEGDLATATSAMLYAGASSPVASASLAATGAMLFAGASSLSASASLSVTGARLVTGAISLAADGDLTAAAAMAFIGAATLSSDGNLAAVAHLLYVAAASLSASATLSATANDANANYQNPTGVILLQAALSALIATLADPCAVIVFESTPEGTIQ